MEPILISPNEYYKHYTSSEQTDSIYLSVETSSRNK